MDNKKRWNAPNLYSVLSARKRYETDLALVHKAMEEHSNLCGTRMGPGINNNLVAESQYMLLSNVIYPKYGDRYSTSMYLQYALGIMRFMEDDIYDVLPKFFNYSNMDNYPTQFVNKYVNKSNNDEITYFDDDSYHRLLGKFNHFQMQRRH